MPSFSTDLLVYGAIAVAFMVFNYIVQKLSAKTRPEQAQAPTVEQMDEPEVDALGDLEWGRMPATLRPEYLAVDTARGPLVRATPPDVVHDAIHALGRRPHPVRERLREASDLRQAMVLLTVLGPCRANQEPDANGR
jgi:hypothetical protein